MKEVGDLKGDLEKLKVVFDTKKKNLRDIERKNKPLISLKKTQDKDEDKDEDKDSKNKDSKNKDSKDTRSSKKEKIKKKDSIEQS